MLTGFNRGAFLSAKKALNETLIYYSLRLGLLKRFEIQLHQVSSALDKHLPYQFPMNTSVGSGSLTIQSVDITLPEAEAGFIAQANTDFAISYGGQVVYRCQLLIVFRGDVCLSADGGGIDLVEVKIQRLNVAKERYFLVEKGREVVEDLQSLPLVSTLTQAVTSTFDLLLSVSEPAGKTRQDLRDFQRRQSEWVFNSHREDIEAYLQQKSAQGELCYRFQPEHFFDRIVIQFGRSIVVADGHIWLYFDRKK